MQSIGWTRRGILMVALTLSLGGCKRPALPESRPEPVVSSPPVTREPDPTPDAAPPAEGVVTPPSGPTPREAPAARGAYRPGERLMTGDPAWDHYLAALKKWQKDSQDLVTARRPDLADISAATLNMHWALLDLKAARVRYLLAEAPQRIVRDQGLAGFINVEWTADDNAHCAEHDPDYADLERDVSAVQEATLAHPKYAASRQLLVDELLTDPAYRELVVKLKEEGDTVARMLNPSLDAAGND